MVRETAAAYAWFVCKECSVQYMYVLVCRAIKFE
jgi:hypothetical protein